MIPIDLSLMDYTAWRDDPPPPNTPGVYVLLQKDGALFYVGQSKTLLERLKPTKKGFWETMRWLPEEDLFRRLRIEAILIAAYYPKKNRHIALSVEGTTGITFEGPIGMLALRTIRRPK